MTAPTQRQPRPRQSAADRQAVYDYVTARDVSCRAPATLTLDQLDDLDQRSELPTLEELDTLVEYARERAARERCEALLPKGWHLSDIEMHRMGEGYQWLATASLACSSDGLFGCAGFQEIIGDHGITPTAAYLALAEALVQR